MPKASKLKKPGRKRRYVKRAPRIFIKGKKAYIVIKGKKILISDAKKFTKRQLLDILLKELTIRRKRRSTGRITKLERRNDTKDLEIFERFEKLNRSRQKNIVLPEVKDPNSSTEKNFYNALLSITGRLRDANLSHPRRLPGIEAPRPKPKPKAKPKTKPKGRPVSISTQTITAPRGRPTSVATQATFRPGRPRPRPRPRPAATPVATQTPVRQLMPPQPSSVVQQLVPLPISAGTQTAVTRPNSTPENNILRRDLANLKERFRKLQTEHNQGTLTPLSSIKIFEQEINSPGNRLNNKKLIRKLMNDSKEEIKLVKTVNSKGKNRGKLMVDTSLGGLIAAVNVHFKSDAKRMEAFYQPEYNNFERTALGYVPPSEDAPEERGIASEVSESDSSSSDDDDSDSDDSDDVSANDDEKKEEKMDDNDILTVQEIQEQSLRDVELADDIEAAGEAVTQIANGKNNFLGNPGLTTDQIDGMMDVFKSFVGTYPSDFLKPLLERYDGGKTLPPKFGFVINLDNSTQSGSHWCAVYVDTHDEYEVNYYCSFGSKPTKDFLKQLKKLISIVKPVAYLKLKINGIVEQNSKSSNCGWFACKFLASRFRGKPFRTATKFDAARGERDIVKFREKYKKFGYI